MHPWTTYMSATTRRDFSSFVHWNDLYLTFRLSTFPTSGGMRHLTLMRRSSYRRFSVLDFRSFRKMCYCFICYTYSQMFLLLRVFGLMKFLARKCSLSKTKNYFFLIFFYSNIPIFEFFFVLNTLSVIKTFFLSEILDAALESWISRVPAL